jgi:uncharacterized protein
MANGFDPRIGGGVNPPTTAGRADVAVDAGLRAHMLSVYNYMTSGVLLTGVIALLFAQSGAVRSLINFDTGAPSLLGWVVLVAPIAIPFIFSFGLHKISAGTAQILFWAYAALLGVSLSTIFLVYTPGSIAFTFFATAAAFASLSLWGYTTKKDLSAFGTFLLMGLVGLIVAMLINVFWQNQIFDLAIAAIGVLIFAGLTAFHTQRTKSIYFEVAGTEWQGRMAILAALQLYLDFINMFLFLLRFFGSRD